MKKAVDKLSLIFTDKVIARRIYAITLGAALLILVIVIKGPEARGSLVTDSGGNAVAIRRHDITATEQYDITLKILEQGEELERDITLSVRGAGENTSVSSGAGSADRRRAEIEAEIDSMITDIEFSNEKEIELPSSLRDGTPVKWLPRKQDDRSGLAAIPVMYLALVIAVIFSGMKSDKDEEAADRETVMRGLPRFCNQLFLMMNAGMILSDAFEKICRGYESYVKDDLDGFERELADIYTSDTDRRISTATLINELASRHNVKELVRIAAILTENERRGSDVAEDLERESKYLWEDRKIVARERGKMIDTKMAWPLGLLLIILIVITMAPALMNM